jgi:hypothetical protein
MVGVIGCTSNVAKSLVLLGIRVLRCRKNLALIRRSGPDSGLGVRVLKGFEVVPSSLEIGTGSAKQESFFNFTLEV